MGEKKEKEEIRPDEKKKAVPQTASGTRDEKSLANGIQSLLGKSAKRIWNFGKKIGWGEGGKRGVIWRFGFCFYEKEKEKEKTEFSFENQIRILFRDNPFDLNCFSRAGIRLYN